MATQRQKLIGVALHDLIPHAPLEATSAIRLLVNRQHMRGLPIDRAVWLATVTHIRHCHTDYHALLADGYDRDSARHFVIDEMNAVLQAWHSKRFVDGTDTE